MLWLGHVSTVTQSQQHALAQVGANRQPPSTDGAAERARVLCLLRRFGCNATSFQALEPGFRYFFDGDDGVVAYVQTAGAWVAAGEPIAPEPRLKAVAERFVMAARAAGRRALFFATEPRFAGMPGFDAVLIGEQPVCHPAEWDGALRKSRSLREQLRRARAKGVRVRLVQACEIAGPDAPLRRSLERLIASWLHSRSMAPMGFLVHVAPFDFVKERRVFVAETDDGVCGMLALVPVYARGGWFLEDLVRAPFAPNGTTELLVDSAMRCAAAEGCSYLTLGLAPLAGEVGRWLRTARAVGRGLYDFSGLRAFKAKFRPATWMPIYLSLPHGRSSHVAIYDSLAAFAQGGLLRFGLASLLRGPAIVVRALTLALLPWTVALAALDSARYFPAPWVKWAWVVFDAGLAAALFALTRRFRPALARALSYVITGDAVLTAVEAATFNLPRARSTAEVITAAVAVAAPTLAAVVLRNAWKRRVLASHP